MAATTTPEQKIHEKKPVFLDQCYFKAFLEKVAEVAREKRVREKDIPLILDVLRKEFGQGLPERW